MPNRKQPHTVVPKGKKVLVRLKSGETFVDHFREKEHSKIVFVKRTILVKELQMMTIYREPTFERDARADKAIAQMGVKSPKEVQKALRKKINKMLK